MYYNGSWVTGSTINDCVSCPLGSSTSGAPAQTSCEACIDGWYGSAPHNCTACPNNTFLPSWNPGSNLSSCQSCPLGYSTFNVTGQTSCEACIDGWYGTGPDNCTACPNDTFLPYWFQGSNSSSCESCPPGYSTSNATGQTFCLDCMDGCYGTGWFGTTGCTPCPPDTYYPSWVFGSTIGNCISCPLGSTTFVSSAGHWTFDGQTSCNSCLDGYYGSGHSDCTPCPFDTFYAPWSPGSTYMDCAPCGIGGSTAGAVGQTSCSGNSFDYKPLTFLASYV